MKKFLPAVAIVLLATAFVGQQYFKSSSGNYSATISQVFQDTKDIKETLLQSSDNLSVNDVSSTTANFIRHLDESKTNLTTDNGNLTNAEVPDKFSDANKKILECLKTEYNLFDRLKDILSLQNEYEAVESFNKSKDLMQELKEKSAMLSVEGNNFDEVFDFSALYEKVEKFLNTRKQLRYDRDVSQSQAQTPPVVVVPSPQNNSASIVSNRYGEHYIGTFKDGNQAYLIEQSVSGNRDNFSCTVRAVRGGKTITISYHFWEDSYGIWHFSNSQGFNKPISESTPVAKDLRDYILWNY